MTSERAARLFVLGLVMGLPLAALLTRWSAAREPAVELRAVMAEAGGWTPADLAAIVGEPLRLRLTSDDVMHGFAVGQMSGPAVDVKPGQWTELTLTFDQAGKYTFYCTRWCGPNHWRMRGTIEVTGPGATTESSPPLYVTLGLDLDAPHPAEVTPEARPSAARGAALGFPLPGQYLTQDYYRAHSPVQAWRTLRAEPSTNGLTDSEVWDLVAHVWRSNTTVEALETGAGLYAQNCAACHGEAGQGDGVMAASLSSHSSLKPSHGQTAPMNFADAETMLGASPAHLQGKIMRGGMGTGMPYWGPIFTETQTWALVDHLGSFMFEYDE